MTGAAQGSGRLAGRDPRVCCPVVFVVKRCSSGVCLALDGGAGQRLYVLVLVFHALEIGGLGGWVGWTFLLDAGRP